MKANQRPAAQFGSLIARNDFAGAHCLLTKNAQEIHSPDELKGSFERMIAYGPGPVREVKVMEDFTLEDWPGKLDGDVAWMYVTFVGDDFVEAVAVVLTEEDGGIRIRSLEWGRP